MPDSNVFPEISIDHLIARQLPDWLLAASPAQLKGLHQALQAQQQHAEALAHLFERIPDLEAFARPRLEQALERAGLADVDVRAMAVVISQEVEFPSAAPKLYQPRKSFTSRQSLLAAAMHNFEAQEAKPSLVRRAHLEGPGGKRLALSFGQFVRLCRALDIGANYQVLLCQVLQPKSGQGQPEGKARQSIEQLFQDSLRARMEVAVHEAAIRAQLDLRTYEQLLPVFLKSPSSEASSRVIPRQLYLLGKPIVGVLTLEIRTNAHGRLESVISWVPDDPSQAVRRHASWQALYDHFAIQLGSPGYPIFFSRFIEAKDQAAFSETLKSLLAGAPHGTAVELDGRNLDVSGGPFSHLRELIIGKIYADARFLAVPTGDEDLRSRHVRLQGMFSAGLDLLGLAGLFIPVLGEVMLAVSAVQLADEVYEGYQAWRLGDRQGALEHLFNVVQALVVAGVTAGVVHQYNRSAVVDALVPSIIDGRIKLAQSADVPHIESSPVALMEGLGDGQLDGLIADDGNDLLAITGYEPDQLRRLRVEHAPAPARLLDLDELYRAHARFPELRGRDLQRQVAALQAPPSTEQGLLINAFSGLSPRAAQEIIDQSSTVQLESLLSTQRIPLAMAERARWYLRDSRLDRACLGLRLQQAVNEDTEQLAMKLVAGKAPWPSSCRIELRADNPTGLLLFESGAEDARDVSVIVRQEQGYALFKGKSAGATPAAGSLLKAIHQSLDAQQKASLGNPQLSLPQLRSWLLESAKGNRDGLARLLGMKPIGRGVRPPRRFADGRTGYSLGGHGESSQQAIRRGIHQIFSTFSELQLDAYINAVRESGVSLWDHYQSLQRQLDSLRQALDLWQSGLHSPIEAIRRHRVADTIRRSWRRKLVDANDDYELVIDGEHIERLPVLPANVSFEHVRRLVLRDMRLRTVDEEFLRRFPNLVELDLSGNQLTQVPAGIERLTQLRRIDLSRNQLLIDEAGNRRLSQLLLLDSCELSFNPLMHAPDLSGLRHVRHLHLRATGQVDIPQLLERASWRALVDLRDNRIWELRQEVQGLNQRLSRFELHDNPLDEAGQRTLEQARDDHAGGARGRPSHRHADVDARVREAWIDSRDTALRDQRQATWDRLQAEPGSADLFRFLADFHRTDDFEEHPGHYRARIWRILDACEQSAVLREQLFSELNQVATCEDRLLLLLNQLEVGLIVRQGITDVPAAQLEERLLRLGRQLYRLDQVDSIATRHVQQMRRSGMRLVDEVEVRLFYRSQLTQVLDLPVPTDDMHFSAFANVNRADLMRAQGSVLQGETTNSIVDSLAQRPYWQDYARRRYTERFEALAAPLHERLEALEEQAVTGTEMNYVSQANELKQELEQAEQQLYRDLAMEAWQRANP